MPEARITKTERTTVSCGSKAVDIYEAVGKVAQGARLVAASFGALEAKLVFDYEESGGDNDGPCR